MDFTGQLSPLPVAFVSSGLRILRIGGTHGFDRVCGGAQIVFGDVSDAGRLSGCVGGESCGAFEWSGSAHRLSAQRAGLHHRHPSHCPCTRRSPFTRCSHCLAGAGVAGALGFEEVEHMLGTVSSPQRQPLVVVIGQGATTADGDHRGITDIGQDHASALISVLLGSAAVVLGDRRGDLLQAGDQVVLDREPAKMRGVQRDVECCKSVVASAHRHCQAAQAIVEFL